MFSLRSFGYQSGWTVAAESAQCPVEHVKNNLQNIAYGGKPHSVEVDFFPWLLLLVSVSSVTSSSLEVNAAPSASSNSIALVAFLTSASILFREVQLVITPEMYV